MSHRAEVLVACRGRREGRVRRLRGKPAGLYPRDGTTRTPRWISVLGGRKGRGTDRKIANPCLVYAEPSVLFSTLISCTVLSSIPVRLSLRLAEPRNLGLHIES